MYIYVYIYRPRDGIKSALLSLAPSVCHWPVVTPNRGPAWSLVGSRDDLRPLGGVGSSRGLR